MSQAAHRGPTRVVLINQYAALGGAARMLLNVLDSIDSDRFHRIVVSPDGPVADVLRGEGLDVRPPPRPVRQFTHMSGFWYPAVHPRFLHTAWRITRDQATWTDYLRGLRPDIVYLNSMTLVHKAGAARAAGAKVMCLVQETAVRGTAGIRTRWVRNQLSSMHAVIFISEFDRQSAACSAPIVRVVPNWISEDWAASEGDGEAARARLGIARDSFVLAMMGGIHAIKGTLTLAKAVALLDDCPDLVLLIAGDCDPPRVAGSPAQRLRAGIFGRPDIRYWSAVMDVVDSTRAAGRIRLLGPLKDTAEVYAAADAVVFPSTVPHQSRPALEAGAFGKPVIISDFPNTREFVEHDVNGLVVPPEAPADLARAIRTLRQDRSLARALGEANRARTLSRHGPGNAALLASVFEELAAQ